MEVGIIKILFNNFTPLDGLIIISGIINSTVIYHCVWRYTNALYGHFNQVDRTLNSTAETIRKLKKHTNPNEKILSLEELLDDRIKMKFFYSLFTGVTAIFPLLGMFGTVWSLIPMVNTMGAESATSFFAALTSTFWGILFAMIGKLLDALIAYRIDDCEEHMQPYIAPHEDATVGE